MTCVIAVLLVNPVKTDDEWPVTTVMQATLPNDALNNIYVVTAGLC